MQRKARRYAKEGQKAYKGRPEGIQRKARMHTKEGQQEGGKLKDGATDSAHLGRGRGFCKHNKA